MVIESATTLILVDGSSYLYRAYYAMPNLTGPDKQATGALYGTINMIRRLLGEWKPERIAVVFDAPGKTFRNDWYDKYKANRPPMPLDLVEQIAPIHAMIKALGIPVIMKTGVEADDVIGTLARKASEAGLKTVISTGDKDMTQLVDDSVLLVNTMTGEKLDHAGVAQKFGVPPERMVDLLALVGDTSDNVPGISKVGPKTAVKWLTEWGTLDRIVENREKFKGKVGENLRSSLEQLELSRRLVTIRTDLDAEETFDVEINSLRLGERDHAALTELCKRYGFSRWLSDYQQKEGTQQTASLALNASTANASTTSSSSPEDTEDTSDMQVTTILDWSAFDALHEKLARCQWFAFDTETTSLDMMEAQLVGISFALSGSAGFYIPMAHIGQDQPIQLPADEVLAKLKPLFENPEIGKLCHYAKYDQHALANAGVELRGLRYDTLLESYVLNSTLVRHSLDALSLSQLNYQMTAYEDVVGRGASQIVFNEVPVEMASKYAVEDACITWRLHEKLYSQLSAIPSLLSVYTEMEVPLSSVLTRIERHGVRIDEAMLNTQAKKVDARLQEIETRAYEEAGEEFNLNSPQQLQTILFEKMKLRVVEKTPKGAPSTSESVLQELALDYVLPSILLEHRTLSKLKSTYLDKLPAQVNSQTGRVHTSYNQAVTATGRLSSTKPNLQNIPVRTPEGRQIREAFIASPGARLVALDYSQIELRIMAELSRDEGLLDAFAHDKDIHRVTASEVFGSPLEQVSSEQRRAAKAINFGLIYGMSAFGLARQLSIPRSAAQEYIKLYFERYPGVKRYMEEIVLLAKEQGYVETLFGRRLYLPEINSRTVRRRQYAERTAINAPMQGTAADIIKRAMITLDTWITQQGDDRIKMIMQVHDELIFDVPKERVDDLVTAAKTQMEQAACMAVPLKVDVVIGRNWGESL